MARGLGRSFKVVTFNQIYLPLIFDFFRLFFGEQDIKGMFDVLEPLHAVMERGPQTLKETSFNQAYGRDLAEAQEWCQRYKVSSYLKI